MMTSDRNEVLWKPEHLGLPIGGSPHAISACLPLWRDVIGYEEGDPRVINALTCGYPRFFLHPMVRKLTEQFLKKKNLRDRYALIFTSHSVADKARTWLVAKGITTECHTLAGGEGGATVVTVPISAEKMARFYWRISGQGLSSRAAEDILNNTPIESDQSNGNQSAKSGIRETLAEIHGVQPGDVYLCASGMSAIFSLIQSARQLEADATHVQIGFPYVDTWKDLENFSPDRRFLNSVESGDLLSEFESISGSVGLILSECPSNPLLETPDPELLRDISKKRGAILAIDDTVASSVNIRALPYADVVTTSLSKWFNGRGDALGGALILNPQSDHYQKLGDILNQEGCWDDDLYERDARVILENSSHFASRVHQAGLNAGRLITFLENHPRVERLHFTDASNSAAYAKLTRAGSTIPALISMELNGGEKAASRFYDNLMVSKGPSLGTDWTLACPYTLLAHYDELEWVESCGVSRNLIRISVGSEPAAELLDIFGQALDSVD